VFSLILLKGDASQQVDYPNPELFRPERFLKEGKLDNDMHNPSHFPWDSGIGMMVSTKL